MKPEIKRPIREISDFLIHQIRKSTRGLHLNILREMMDRVLLERYCGNETLAHEYSRVDMEIRLRERQLQPNDVEIETMCQN